ncbi:MAG: hypothetical protein KIS74_14925 [Burkholderiales bacterium]|nr:hypothetical protein [Burkholderiales bacterium]
MKSPEGKINAVFPETQALVAARKAVFALLESQSPEVRKSIETELATRTKLRALDCAKAYSPGWHESGVEIRQRLDNPDCFANADAETTRWLSLRRVGLMLALPALRPIPAPAPAYIVAPEFIQHAIFAQAAGVALLQTSSRIVVADLRDGKPLLNEARGERGAGTLSPNGRIFIGGDSRAAYFRSSETGETIAEIPGTRPASFNWVDSRTAVFEENAATPSRTMLVDFESGRVVPVPAIRSPAQRGFVAAAGGPNRYVLVSHQSVALVELARGGAEPGVRLLDEKPLPGASWASNTSGVTADGGKLFSVSTDLLLIPLDTLEAEKVAFDPMHLQVGTGLPKGEGIIVSGFMTFAAGQGSRHYLFRPSTRTLEPIDTAKLLSQRFVAIAPLRKIGVIDGAKITVLDEIPVLPAVTLSDMQAGAIEESNRVKLEAFEREAQAAKAARAAGPVASPIPGPLVALARDAKIEAVGLYKGGGESSQPSWRGKREKREKQAKPGELPAAEAVEIRAMPSSRPLVLVLSSYEPVRWLVTAEAGSKLSAIILSGNERSEVFGVHDVHMVRIGKQYAYNSASREFSELDAEVRRWTGRPIGAFQGRYEGGSFFVGR